MIHIIHNCPYGDFNALRSGLYIYIYIHKTYTQCFSSLSCWTPFVCIHISNLTKKSSCFIFFNILFVSFFPIILVCGKVSKKMLIALLVVTISAFEAISSANSSISALLNPPFVQGNRSIVALFELWSCL